MATILIGAMAALGAPQPPDYTPTVTGTWSAISDLIDGGSSVDSGNVTLSDINQSISLYYTLSGSTLVTVYRSINNGAFIQTTAGSANTFTISNNDTLKWRITTSFSSTVSGSISIFNASDSNASINGSIGFNLRQI